MKYKFGTLLISLAIALIFQALIVVLHHSFSDSPSFTRFFALLGGTLPEGIIQFVTYFLFVFGLLEIRGQANQLSVEEQTFKLKILPEKENWVLSPTDVAEINMKVIAHLKREKNILLDLIKKACTKYRANKSTSEALEVVTNQVRINLANAESEQSLIRYAAWAIPSVGFIGTIIGIANSLGYAGEASNPEGIKKVTEALNVAFDTTLVALFLSLFLMLFYHIFQEKTEKLHSRMESYIIENLINRIYNR